MNDLPPNSTSAEAEKGRTPTAPRRPPSPPPTAPRGPLISVPHGTCGDASTDSHGHSFFFPHRPLSAPKVPLGLRVLGTRRPPSPQAPSPRPARVAGCRLGAGRAWGRGFVGGTGLRSGRHGSGPEPLPPRGGGPWAGLHGGG